MKARYFAVVLLTVGLVLGFVMEVRAQYYMPGYPYPNPMVGGYPYAYPSTFNPWTGTWNYNTGNTQTYGSYYQPGRNWVAPGSMQPVFQPNPVGGYQQGYIWRDLWGNPHGNVSNVTPNPWGGVNTTRQMFSTPGAFPR